MGIFPLSSLPSASTVSMAASRGAGPLELRPNNFLSFSDQTRAKASEPMPLAVGSTTVRAEAAATAASMALPPLRRASSPAAAAWGEEQFTMPSRA